MTTLKMDMAALLSFLSLKLFYPATIFCSFNEQ